VLQSPQALLPPPVPAALKEDITLLGALAPQSGQLSLSPLSPLEHNFSKRLPQLAHLNSYIGMQH